jgi:DNA adenine methylase
MKEHFYHVGAKESNRNSVCEALIINFKSGASKPITSLDIGSLEKPVWDSVVSSGR